MRGYPKHINTKQDIINLKNNHPEFKEQLKKDIDVILSEPEAVTKTIGFSNAMGRQPHNENMNIENMNIIEKRTEITNETPGWKTMGFRSKGELTALRNTLDN